MLFNFNSKGFNWDGFIMFLCYLIYMYIFQAQATNIFLSYILTIVTNYFFSYKFIIF